MQQSIESRSRPGAGQHAAPDQGRGRRAEAGRIEVSGITRRFGRKVALQPLDLVIEGGVVGLLGPNGSGKSTFMRILVGLVRPDAGEARVDGVDLTGDGTAIRQRVAYSPGELHLYGELSGREQLRWLLRGRGGEAQERATELARGFGLPLEHRVRTYSHGMKRQLSFAAVLAPRVRVRILDEATEGLDPSKRSEVLDLLRADAANGVTVLLSSHHLGEVDRACDRLVFMNEGRKVADEMARDVTRRARRLVQVGWPEGTLLDGVEAALEGQGVERLRLDGTHLTVFLTDDDPRPFLARLAAAALPAPSRVEHGRVSLQELYRDLYGVEGC